MICVAISTKDYRACIATLHSVELAEIRLDLTEYDDDTIDSVFAQETPTIATCRPDEMGEQQQYFKLRRAIDAGAAYIDVEIEAAEDQQKALIKVAKEKNCKVIISYHNYEETPSLQELKGIVAKCYDQGADIAKVATMVNSNADNAKLAALYEEERPLVAVGMGQLGKLSRITAPLLGAEFTFASEDNSAGTAPGQIEYTEMKNLLQHIEKTLDK